MYLSISEKNLKPAPNSPKENSGANGKFLPKPLLFHLRLPNSKTNEPKFWQILSPKNSFAKTSSALKPHARGACEVIGFGNRCELGTIETHILFYISPPKAYSKTFFLTQKLRSENRIFFLSQ